MKQLKILFSLTFAYVTTAHSNAQLNESTTQNTNSPVGIYISTPDGRLIFVHRWVTNLPLIYFQKKSVFNRLIKSIL